MMKINVLKTTKAAIDDKGIESKEYVAGETYEMSDSTADLFISQGWGEKEENKAEEKSLKIKLEDKAIKKVAEDKKVESKETKKKKTTKKKTK